MTSEEIKRAVEEVCNPTALYVSLDDGSLPEKVESKMRELVALAYEEAAQIVEQANITSGIRPKFPIRGGGPYTAMRAQVGHSKAQLATSIRALRDSLLETVPSR